MLRAPEAGDLGRGLAPSPQVELLAVDLQLDPASRSRSASSSGKVAGTDALSRPSSRQARV